MRKCRRQRERGTLSQCWPFKKDQPKGFLESNLEACQGTLIRLVGEQVEIQRVINLETMMGTGSIVKVTHFEPTSGDCVNGTLIMKYPVDQLVGVIRVDQCMAWKCYDESTRVTNGRRGACTRPKEARVRLLEMDPQFD
ncbi:hypothetical protein CR513_08855, partial [Mucuna pruriens]